MDTITITLRRNSVWRDGLDLSPWFGSLRSLAGCEVRMKVGDVLLTTALDDDGLPQGIEIVDADKMQVVFSLDAAGRAALPLGDTVTDLMVVPPEGDPHVLLDVVVTVAAGVTPMPEDD